MVRPSKRSKQRGPAGTPCARTFYSKRRPFCSRQEFPPTTLDTSNSIERCSRSHGGADVHLGNWSEGASVACCVYRDVLAMRRASFARRLGALRVRAHLLGGEGTEAQCRERAVLD